MLSASDIILEYVCPAAGVITASLMFSAPYFDVKRATENGSLGTLNPTPWAFMLANTAGWITYSFLIQNLFVYFANAPGFLLSIYLNMQAVKLQYENHRSRELRKSIVSALEESKHLVPESSSELGSLVWTASAQKMKIPAPHENLVLGLVTLWVGVIAIVAFGNDAFDSNTRKLIVGITVNLNLVFFYGAPLSTIFTVLKERDSSSIHVRTMITNTLNGAFWCAYGIATLDLFIAVPNGLGAALGVLQIFLSVIFPRKIAQSKNGSVNGLVEQSESASDDRLADIEQNRDRTQMSASPSQETFEDSTNLSR